MLPVYNTLQEAYIECIRSVRAEGQNVPAVQDQASVASRFGTQSRNTTEILGHGFVLSNPRSRLVWSKARPFDFRFCLANFIWTMGGSDDLATIAFYNPRGADFSPDGMRLFGAMGARIAAQHYGGQLENVVRKLEADPSSRRATIQVFMPEDLINSTLDTPCTLSLQYLIRENKLVAITHMRSQSVLMLLPADVFLFTMLQEAIASWLGVEPGHYFHYCGSMHYYEDEFTLVEQVLDEQPDFVPQAMPRMLSFSPDILGRIGIAEKNIRTQLGKAPDAAIDLDGYELDPYWIELLETLAVLTRLRLTKKPQPSMIKLPLPYQAYVHL